MALLGAWLALLLLAVGDLWEQWLPDIVTGPLVWLGLLFSPLAPLEHLVFGAVLGYLTLWVVGLVTSWWAGRDAMGSGDLWMAGALGAWVGAPHIMWVVLLAFTAVTLLRPLARDDYVPLGVPLAGAGMVVGATLLVG